MGTIDKTTHKLICTRCEVTEEASVLDKGSGWSGSYWHDGASFSHFKTTWKGGGDTEPSIVTAECNSCGEKAQHESRFGGV